MIRRVSRARSLEAEADLITRYQAGDRRAGDALLRMHEALIYTQVRLYFGKGCDPADLLQEGRIAFLHAVDRYDAGRGAKLITYAALWVRQAAAGFIADNRSTIRVPRKAHLSARASTRVAVKRARRAKRLDAGIFADATDGERFTLGDVIPDPSGGPEELLLNAVRGRARTDLATAALAMLSDRERTIVERHIMADEPETFEAIAPSVGRVTRERVRQLEARALRNLRVALAERFVDAC